MSYMIGVEGAVLFASIAGHSFAMEGIVKGDARLKSSRPSLIILLIPGLYICAVRTAYLARSLTNKFIVEIDTDINKCAQNVEHRLEAAGFLAFFVTVCITFLNHFISIVHPFKYKQWMKSPVIKYSVVLIWMCAFLSAFADGIVFFVSLVLKAEKPNSFLTLSFDRCDISSIADSGAVVDISYSNSSSLKAGLSSGILRVFETDAPNLKRIITILMRPRSRCFFNISTKALLNKVMSLAEEQEDNSWCAVLEGKYRMALDCTVLVMTFLPLAFTGISYAAFRNSVHRATGQTKIRLKKLVKTTLLLIGVFSICWIPFAAQELVLAVLMQLKSTRMVVAYFLARFNTTSLVVSHSLYTLFLLAPLAIPLIYVSRLEAVNMYLKQRYITSVCPVKKRHPSNTPSASTAPLLTPTVHGSPTPELKCEMDALNLRRQFPDNQEFVMWCSVSSAV